MFVGKAVDEEKRKLKKAHIYRRSKAQGKSARPALAQDVPMKLEQK
jgi:predicted transcriptional regulator